MSDHLLHVRLTQTVEQDAELIIDYGQGFWKAIHKLKANDHIPCDVCQITMLETMTLCSLAKLRHPCTSALVQPTAPDCCRVLGHFASAFLQTIEGSRVAVVGEY